MDMKSSVVLLHLLVLLLLRSCPVQSVIKTSYWYNTKPRTWQEAQEVCRRDYSGSLALTDRSLAQLDLTKYQAWFGLKEQQGGWAWVYGDYEDPGEELTNLTSATSGIPNQTGTNQIGQAGYSGPSGQPQTSRQRKRDYNIMNEFADGEPESGEQCGKVMYQSDKYMPYLLHLLCTSAFL